MTPHEEYVLGLMHSRGLDIEPLEPEPERLPIRKPHHRMTSRNRERAIRMRESGKSMKCIAEELDYSVKTIKRHLKNPELQCVDM